MRITVAPERCIGAGNCALTAPTLFEQDDEDGTVVLLAARPAPGEHDLARGAARLCPSRSITVTGDTADD